MKWQAWVYGGVIALVLWIVAVWLLMHFVG